MNVVSVSITFLLYVTFLVQSRSGEGTQGGVQTETSLRRSQLRLQHHFRTVSQKPLTHISGRGIVIPAGSTRHLVNAYVVIKVIRQALNSTLPIEVYFDGDTADQSVLIKLLVCVPSRLKGSAQLNSFGRDYYDSAQGISGVTVHDTELLLRPQHLSPWPKRLHGYAKKVFSLYSTSFEQVLLLDSDSQPLVKPDSLFELPTFRHFGAVFWPDYWTANSAEEAPKPEVYTVLGIPEPWVGEPAWACVESGQILFDKNRHFDVLEWIMWVNLWTEVVYNYVFGDKDTYEMGFMLSNKHDQFYRIPTPPRTAFTEHKPKTEQAPLVHVGIVQSIDGKPSFLHRVSGGKFDIRKPALSMPDQQSSQSP